MKLLNAIADTVSSWTKQKKKPAEDQAGGAKAEKVKKSFNKALNMEDEKK